MEISIHRALGELKLLDSRINKKISSVTFIKANKKSAKKINYTMTEEDFKTKVKSDYDSIKDLIERRKLIKSLIVASNAVTKKKVAGIEMTIAEIIERKDTIKYDKQLLAVMKAQYNCELAKANKENEKVDADLKQLLAQTYGKEASAKPSEDQYNAVAVPFLAQNEWTLIDPARIVEEIEKFEELIDNFESEADVCLSESNASTFITIPD